jgi:hypothetical protein
MTLEYRKNRIHKIIKYWDFKREHDLMASFLLDKDFFLSFKSGVKNYISKALGFYYTDDDNIFLQRLEKNKDNRKNVTPNGAVVPKREFHLEYNIILRDWANIIRKVTNNNPEFLKRFRITPNIRIKYGDELKDNVNRPLNTSLPHSDAWVEGPWGMNCYVPLLGDTDNNTLLYYEPKEFKEEFLKTAATYTEMQWVMKYYQPINFVPQKGRIYVSDYALIHNTQRKKGCGTRISIDTTIFIGEHEPHPDRLKEYRDQIPFIGQTEFVDAGQNENEEFAEKISTFSHYTSKAMKTIKF